MKERKWYHPSHRPVISQREKDEAVALMNVDIYDKDATIDIDMTDEDFLTLANIAHEKDITFNQLINDIMILKMEEENGKNK